MRTIRLQGGDLGSEFMLVRCNLQEASSPVEVDYGDGEGFVSTQFQCADCCHYTKGLVDIAKTIAARACEVNVHEFQCESEVL